MIKLELKIEEVQLILNALYTLPYAQVSKLIEAIVAEANTQLEASKKAEKK